MTRTTARFTGLAGALVAGTLLLAGCADDGSDTTHNGPMMGSSNSSDSSSGDAEGSFDDTDVAFARDMIPHHQQAIQMARLADGQAEDPRVLDLAGRIEAAQQPEIDTLSGWLQDWDADTGHMDDDGMGGMGGMGGMMSEQDMHALMNATGAEFDRLFLEQMITHHKGAVQMAEAEIADGQNPDAIALAESIRDSQTAEIAEMEQLLTELGG
ncbi:DUF305 domain-containing protein [Blastococcus jejuensis]|uniref:DUF305 domain-containing protein n=1 Tax=Blastococcus jejuensis TaxID=351224 RepID=A0ABP6P3N8_9ACTN